MRLDATIRADQKNTKKEIGHLIEWYQVVKIGYYIVIRILRLGGIKWKIKRKSYPVMWYQVKKGGLAWIHGTVSDYGKNVVLEKK